ncbi:MAG: ATP-dependent Clp protease ATP-binding subunit [Clostridia bacterium]|nr:ATP-dependent Clp protease ATP-binding subunit [Clostridia bacterium]
MKMCAVCKRQPAVVFVSKSDGKNIINEGYCLKCAIDTGVTPINQLASQFQIDPEELKSMVSSMEEMLSDENINDAFMDILGGGNLMMPQGEDDAGNDADAPHGEPIGNIFGDGAGAPKRKKGKKSALDTFGVNLTEKAKNDLLDRVIGREKEIERAIQILNRRSKNNPVLLGAPGVGKTAIADGIAIRIASKDVPEKLAGAQVYLLDLANIVAGTQYRGQFESRLKNIVDEAKRGNVILVIDEIHSIVSAGDADGAMNAANILKPALSKGDIQVIGATTLEEYRKYIEKDAALERRFQPVIIDEPSMEETIEILKGTKDYYESFHNVTIDDFIIREAVVLSQKYIHDRYQPDKSIDVIDEAASKLNIDSPYSARIISAKESLQLAEAKLAELEGEDNAENPPYEEIARAKSDKMRLESELQALRTQQRQTKVTVDDVARVIELWTGIPVKNITETDKHKLLNLEERLHRRIVGQDKAVEGVARAVRRNRALKLSKKRPVSFIFVGPTGVGKTELVKALAQCLFDDESALVRIDMSEYMEKHTVSKLIGAPPGYVGYDDAGQLTEKIRRKPYSVILLDEIEKAHADVFNILLQILDDGRITDSQGRVVNFENTIIIMTSNAGTSVGSSSGFGFMNGAGEISSRVDAALKELFRPEFLNRVDEIIEFNPLTAEQLLKIVDLMLADVVSELKEMGLGFRISEAAKQLIVDNSYNPRMGARPIRREIQTTVEDEISNILLAGDIPENATVSVDVTDGRLTTALIKL